MKKTVNVNVGGFAFIVEEYAYEQLNRYLQSVRLNLGNDVDANEVMSDIEMRIAELFKQELKTNGKEVIEQSLIDNVIGIMGKPEDYNNGEPVNEKQQAANEEYVYNTYATQRQLFRNPDEKMLGGVCSGLANYFGWDPLAMRIIFVLLLFGFGIAVPIYIVLWILVPEARTNADKLRMRGQPVNLDTLKGRFNDFKRDVESLGKDERQAKIKNAAYSFGSKVESAVSDFGRVFGKILGIAFLTIGIVLFALFIKYIVSGSISFPESHYEKMFLNKPELFFENRFDYHALIGGGLVLFVLMTWGLISSGIEFLFDLKIKSKPVKYITATISTLAIISVIYGAISLGINYTHDQTVTKRYAVYDVNNEVHVEVMPDAIFNNKLTANESDEDELINITQSQIQFGYPTLEVKLSETGQNYMEVERSATGQKNIKAIEHCDKIDYPVTVDSSHIRLSPVFTTSIKNKFRAQNVVVKLYLKDGTILVNDNNLKRIYNSYNSFTKDESAYDGKKYKMTQNGLSLIEK